jgi:hypothetical protein
MISVPPEVQSPRIYSLHGLTISCDFACPELTPASGRADVRVTVGDVPAHLESPRRTGVLFEAAPGHYLLNIDGVARYWARGGSEVLVDPAAGA